MQRLHDPSESRSLLMAFVPNMQECEGLSGKEIGNVVFGLQRFGISLAVRDFEVEATLKMHV